MFFILHFAMKTKFEVENCYLLGKKCPIIPIWYMTEITQLIGHFTKFLGVSPEK